LAAAAGTAAAAARRADAGRRGVGVGRGHLRLDEHGGGGGVVWRLGRCRR
jgi:hypothetical protein